MFRVSSPDHVFLPIPNWEHKEHPETEEDVGPVIQHIYEVRGVGLGGPGGAHGGDGCCWKDASEFYGNHAGVTLAV